MRAKDNQKDWLEDAKKRAVLKAVKHVKNRYVVGLGTGTTAALALIEIGKIIRQKNWKILGVPTSHQSFLLAVECRIPVSTLDEHPRLDLNIDGADQVDPELNMIKGMGGALTREKVVASASKLNVIVIDETKLVKKLGVNHPVPVEVLPFAIATVSSVVRKMGGNPILRSGMGKVGPTVTDNGNFILDVWFELIDSPATLDTKLKSIPGIVETGLFIKRANIVYAGTKNTVRELSRK